MQLAKYGGGSIWKINFFFFSPVSSPSLLLAESVATSEVESTDVVDKTIPEREDVQG